MTQKSFFTYIVVCADGSLYCGWTTDLDQRLETHNSGKGAKYTRARLPVRLQAFWCCESKQEAMRWEWQLKQWPRPKKRELIGLTQAYYLLMLNRLFKGHIADTPQASEEIAGG